MNDPILDYETPEPNPQFPRWKLLLILIFFLAPAILFLAVLVLIWMRIIRP